MPKKTVLYSEWGWYAEVYADDGNDSGYGDNPRVGRWYDLTREACEQVPIHRVKLYPVKADNSADPFDLACERRHDGA